MIFGVWGRGLVALSVVWGAAGCKPEAYTCATDADCGEEGICEPNSACSFPDETCNSGRRYAEHSALASACVPAGDGDATDAGPSSDADGTSAVTSTSGEPPDTSATTSSLTSGSDDGGSTTSTSDNGCPLAGPPNAGATAMVRISDSMGDYCIDAYETTFRQYLDFLTDDGLDYLLTHDYDPVACAANVGAIPTAGGDNPQWAGWWNEITLPDNADSLDDAVRFVDWCDAKAYCAYYGKRLCGLRGGGEAAENDAWDGSAFKLDTEWGYACSTGVDEYPMGSPLMSGAEACADVSGCPEWVDQVGACGGAVPCDLQTGPVTEQLEGSGVCNDGKGLCSVACADNWLQQSDPVGSHPQCRGASSPRDELYDMAGSANEWTSLCRPQVDPPGDTECFVAGGHMYFAPEYNTCSRTEPQPRLTIDQWAGIRCCAAPTD